MSAPGTVAEAGLEARAERARRVEGMLRGLAVGFALALALGAVWTASRLGLFAAAPTAERAELGAAALSLVGGLGAAALTLLGVLISSSVDSRRLDHARLEAERARAERERAREAEAAHKAREGERLAVEVALKALAELGAEPPAEMAPVHRAGVVLALADLGRFRLALPLTQRMLAEGIVSAGAAAWVIDQAMRRAEEDAVRAQAAMILVVNPSPFLADDGGSRLPICVFEPWSAPMTPDVGFHAASAVVDLVTLRPAEAWSGGSLLGLALALIWWRFGAAGEAYVDARALAGAGLAVLLELYPEEMTLRMPGGTGEATPSVAEMRAAIAESGETAVGVRADGRLRAEALEAWRAAAADWVARGGNALAGI